MGLLDRLGLGRKKPRPVGQTLEKGRTNDRKTQRNQALVKALIFVALFVLTILAYPHRNVFEYSIARGDVWRRETLVAPFDFPIYKDEQTLERERAEVRMSTPPYFREVPRVLERIAANRDSVQAQLARIFEAYGSYRLNAERGRMAEAARDSVIYQRFRNSSRLKASSAQWRLLLYSYLASQPGFLDNIARPENQKRLDQELLADAFDYSKQLVSIGVMDVPLDSVYAPQITVRNEQERVDRLRNRANLLGLNEAYSSAQSHFASRYGEDKQKADLAGVFFRAIFVPNLEYLRAETAAELERKQNRISPTQGAVQTGEAIVRQGQVVTDETSRKLESLAQTARQRGADRNAWRITLGHILATLAAYLLFFLYLYLLRRSIFDNNRMILLIAILFGVIVMFFGIAMRLPSLAMYSVPVAIVSVLLTVIFDSRVGMWSTMTLGLVGGCLLGFDFEFAFATMFSGILGVFSVRDVKNRGQFFLSSILVFLGYALVLTSSWLIFGTSWSSLRTDLLLVAINAFLLISAYPVLWLFERAFDITTDLTLLELSDTNRPLLKELSLRAPGTFNHSLQVANLAEAAADAIGANALLTRVGALYHDIGKMLKPEYYVENQRPGMNPHNNLKPRMSSLIIASHVKEGLELGREYNLPQRVLKFIPMHHGTTRIEFFYRKAIEQKAPDDPPVQESEFRYPGPRPDSKETGILMLADSVEAASRTLAEPTHKRLETLIDMLIKARIEDNQLDMSDLTFRDLDVIKDTFLSMLLGIYHLRVRYPGAVQGDKPTQPVTEQTSES